MAVTGSVSTGVLQIDVTASLQAWQADPTANLGWAFLPSGTDGVDFYSSESGNAPRLIVDFTQATAVTNTATAGNDTLTGGSGDDTLFGGAGDDILNGTDSVAVGLNELDTLMGGGGADQFILGDANIAFYSTGGSLDYVVIQDFTAGVDTIQLHGSASNYQQSAQAGDVFLYHGANQDLVAQVENITFLDFNSHVAFI